MIDDQAEAEDEGVTIEETIKDALGVVKCGVEAAGVIWAVQVEGEVLANEEEEEVEAVLISEVAAETLPCLATDAAVMT